MQEKKWEKTMQTLNKYNYYDNINVIVIEFQKKALNRDERGETPMFTNGKFLSCIFINQKYCQGVKMNKIYQHG